MHEPFIKVCGITSPEDAEMCVRAGATALGINLVAGSKRAVDINVAQEIAGAVRGKALLVAVVADMAWDQLVALRDGFDRLQLHGHESDEEVAALLPHAWKAVRMRSEADVPIAERVPGDVVLLDGATAGSGVPFDWRLAALVARTRRGVILAGGLTPENVAQAISIVSPCGVDAASGVETPGDPRKKDESRVRAFVQAARTAWSARP